MAINLSNISQYFQYPSKVAELKDRLYNILKNKGIEVAASESLNSLIEKVREVEPALEPQTIYLTQNNTSYDVTEYTEAVVDVPPVTVENDLDGLIDGSLTSFTMPSNISTLASARFSNFTNLSTAIMPDVKDIPENTFEQCLTLQEITLPKVETIGSSAFKDCYNLSNIVADNVIQIGSSAFHNCYNLENFSADKLKYIPNSAFYGCINLSVISLPNVTNVGSNIFGGCYNLREINLPQLVDLSSNTFSWMQNLEYLSIPKITLASALNLPKNMLNTELRLDNLSYLSTNLSPESIFINNWPNLTSISLNDLQVLTNGGYYTYFVGKCDNLETINLPKLTSTTYLKLATDNYQLKSINIPYLRVFNNMSNDSSYIINNCINLESINVKYIEYIPSYFMNNNKISYIDASLVRAINPAAFRSMSYLEGINASYLGRIDNSAFEECSNLRDIKLNYIYSIGSSAFKGCSNLSTSVYMTSTYIGADAFNGCYSISDIYLNTLSTVINQINFDAFSNCGVTGLSGNIYVPNSMLSSYRDIYSYYPFSNKFKAMTSEYENDKIFAWKYYYQSSLSSIPEEEFSKRIIYDGAFYSALNSSIYSFNFPNVEYIGSSAFYNSPYHYNRSITWNFPKCKAVNYRAFWQVRSGSFSFPELEFIAPNAFENNQYNGQTNFYMPKVKYIGSYAFSANYGGISFINSEFPDLEYIGEYAFNNTYSLYVSSNILSMPKLKNIPNYAFGNINNMSSLSIYIPEVETIGNNAFYYCQNLSSVTLSNIQCIGDSAFYYCYNLRTIDSLYNCKYIGSYAFSYCQRLNLSLSSPNLLKISTGAFSSCYSITYLSLPELIDIGADTFYYCYNLSTFYAPKLSYVRGQQFFNCYKLSNLSLDFNNVTEIGYSAFTYCSSLSELSFKNASQVGSWAFYGCNNLSNLTLSPKFSDIKSYTFGCCYNLNFDNINLENIKYISDGAFASCRKLSQFTNSYISSVSNYLFTDCSGLQTVNIPNASTIGYYTFGGCSKLETLNINFSLISNIPAYAFYNCQKISSLPFTNLYSMSSSAFKSCYNLQTISLGRITTIPSDAFYDCSGLSSIDTRNIIRIDDNAFLGCRSLSYIDLGNIQYIGGAAFMNCINLNIELPSLSAVWANTYNNTAIDIISNSYITSIAYSAFANCRNLSEINIPNVTHIGDNAFQQCYNLSSVVITNISSIGQYTFCSTGLSEIPYEFDEKFSTINAGTFKNCTRLNKVVLSSCIRINSNAFENCTNNSIINLSNVKHLSNLGLNAFLGNSNVNDIILPEIESLRSISFYWYDYNKVVSENTNYSIFGCGSVKNLYAPKCSNFASYVFSSMLSNLETVDLRNCWSIYSTPFRDNTHLISIDIRNMSYIRDYEFSNCYNLNSVNIDGALSIGGSAFRKCSSLTSIKAGKVAGIGYGVFSDCHNLSNISFNYLNYISDYAFYRCDTLSNLNTKVIENVTTYAFGYCSKLKSIKLTRAWDAFHYCSSLESLYILNCNSTVNNVITSQQFISTPISQSSYLGYYGSIYVPSSVLSYYVSTFTQIQSRFAELPSSITSEYIMAYQFSSVSISIADINTNAKYILSNAFNSATFTDFNSLTLPNIKYIGNHAFIGCSNLSEIMLNNCDYIGSYAFSGCSNLTNIYIPNVYSIGLYAFNNCTNLSVLSLPNLQYLYNIVNSKNTSLKELYLNSAREIYGLSYISSLERIDAPEAIYWEGPSTANLTYINLPKLSYIKMSSMPQGSYNFNRLQLSSYVEYLNFGVGASYLSGETYGILSNISFGSILLSNLSYVSYGLLMSVTADYLNLHNATYLSGYALYKANIQHLDMPNITLISSYALYSAKIDSNVSFEKVKEIYQYGMAYFNSNVLSLPNVTYIANSAFYSAKMDILKIGQRIMLSSGWPALCYTSITNMVFDKGISYFYCGYQTSYNSINLTNNTLLERVVFNGPAPQTNSIAYNYKFFMNTPISNSGYLGYYGSVYVPARYLSDYQTVLSHYSSRITTIEEHETELRNLGLID